MRIELDNKTHWRSDHLKAFITRGVKDERPDLCKRGAPALRVRVVYTRSSGTKGSSGYASYNSNRMCIRLAKEGPDKVDLAGVIYHELAHTRGVKHDAMRGSPRYRRVGNYRRIYGWGFDLPLEKVEKKSKKIPVDVKLAHAEKMLKAAMTREKGATTLRKKWEAKVRYYTKRAAMLPPPPKPPAPPKLKQPGLAEFVESFGFRLEELGDNEYEVFPKEGYNLGDGCHSRICRGVRDVKETVDVYQFMVEPCPDDCDCRE
jgi:hypothetical protein